MRRKMEVGVYLAFGIVLGVGIASYRSFLPGQAALAQEASKVKPPAGIFSPPGTVDGGTVVPAPGEPPFKGKIGRTIGESTPDWPPMARAPRRTQRAVYRARRRRLRRAGLLRFPGVQDAAHGQARRQWRALQ